MKGPDRTTAIGSARRAATSNVEQLPYPSLFRWTNRARFETPAKNLCGRHKKTPATASQIHARGARSDTMRKKGPL
jgi:hypothetical protein